MRVDRVRVAKFEVFKGESGKWFWRLWSANGTDKIADGGQGYAKRGGVLTAISKLRLIVASATIAEGD